MLTLRPRCEAVHAARCGHAWHFAFGKLEVVPSEAVTVTPAGQVTLPTGPGNAIVKAAFVKRPPSEAADSARQSSSPPA